MTRAFPRAPGLLLALTVWATLALSVQWSTLSLVMQDLQTFGGGGGSSYACGAAPAPAQLVGYCTQTFYTAPGGFSTANVDTAATNAAGYQWYIWNFFGVPQYTDMISFSGGNIVIAADASSPAGECCVASAVKTGTSPFYHGVAFGGGEYVEATISFNAALVGSGGGPSFWSMTLEHLATANDFWPDPAAPSANYEHYFEGDFFECFSCNGTSYSGTTHDWYGVYSSTCSPSAYCNYQVQQALTQPASYSSFNRIGALIIPATSGTQGSITYYLNGVQTGSTQHWTQYNGATQAPPPSGSTPWSFGVVDTQHLVLLLGGANAAPMTVQSVQVWQASAANNLTN